MAKILVTGGLGFIAYLIGLLIFSYLLLYYKWHADQPG